MADASRPINIVVINGSARPGNYTGMAAAIVADELQKHPKVSVEAVESGALHLPFPGTDPDSPATKHLQDLVRSAAGVVLATPEYHGSFSSIMKLVIENLGFPSVLAAKPVQLVGVAAGEIGAVKSLEQLRSVVSHIGGMVLPMPVSIANVQKAFDKDGRVLNPDVEKRLRRAGTNLMNYIEKHICPALTLERLMREGAAQPDPVAR